MSLDDVSSPYSSLIAFSYPYIPSLCLTRLFLPFTPSPLLCSYPLIINPLRLVHHSLKLMIIHPMCSQMIASKNKSSRRGGRQSGGRGPRAPAAPATAPASNARDRYAHGAVPIAQAVQSRQAAAAVAIQAGPRSGSDDPTFKAVKIIISNLPLDVDDAAVKVRCWPSSFPICFSLLINVQFAMSFLFFTCHQFMHLASCRAYTTPDRLACAGSVSIDRRTDSRMLPCLRPTRQAQGRCYRCLQQARRCPEGLQAMSVSSPSLC